MKSNSKTIKLISSLLILLILVPNILFSAPKKADAFWFSTWLTDAATTTTAGAATSNTAVNTTSLALQLKNFAKDLLKQVLMNIARQALKKMTQGTINWINSGFHGKPLFVENPGSFFKDIGKYEVKTFVDQIGYNNLKLPFGKAVALNVIKSYKRTSLDNSQYTLSKVINDPVLLNNFRNDFYVGGWNGFLINTQYPQNNYLGYQMMATDQLSRKLQGTNQNAAQKIQTTLNQGQGFLSPQTCPSNPNYPIATDPFNPPSFQKTKFDPPPLYTIYDPENPNANEYGYVADPALQNAYDQYVTNWNLTNEVNKENFNTKYTCPGGLKNTTPGSLVGNQIAKALGNGTDQTTLAAAMGNSVSAILDALLNHFLQKGLNSLATKINGKPVVDNWSFDGQTLGGPTDNPNDSWSTGPDQEILLSGFKKQLDGKTIVTDKDGATIVESIGDSSGKTLNVDANTTVTLDNTNKAIITTDGVTTSGTFIFYPGDIENTQKELGLISTDDLTKPGTIEVLELTWPQIRTLDRCVPGPDVGWEDRTLSEEARNSNKLQGKLTDSDGNLAAQADLALKELKFAVAFFKDWVNTQMMKALPDSITYLDAVAELPDLSQHAKELTDARRVKMQTLARIQAIKVVLDTFTTQPPPRSDREKVLIDLKKQYDATRDSISTSASVDNQQSDLNVAKDRLSRDKKLLAQCNTERTQVGWQNLGNNTLASGPDGVTELDKFCSIPIAGGYSHDSFRGPDTVQPQLPMVNAVDVLKWRGFLGIRGYSASIAMNCNTIFRANVLDYKGDIPGINTVGQDYAAPLDWEDAGGNECAPPPTIFQKIQSDAATANMVNQLNAITVPFDAPYTTPPPADYQAAVQSVVDQINSQYSLVQAAYGPYVNDNVVALQWTYIVGPADHKVSNVVGIGSTWRAVDRVFCDTTPAP